MKPSLLWKALGAAVALAPIAGAHAASDCKPVNGSFEAQIVPPGVGHCPNVPGTFCTAGRVWGGIQGNYQFVMTGSVPAASIGGIPTALFFAGQSTVFMKDASIVHGTDSGTLDLFGQDGFASLITFTSGAAGQVRLRGAFDPAAATTSGDYAGELCAA